MTLMAKILVVDDSWVARLGMNRLLVSLGHDVIEAHGGAQALDILAQVIPDAVFLDLLMPDLDGLGVLEALKSRKSTVPVFVVSADIQDTTVQRCLELGARQCLPKPPTRAGLQASLGTLQ